MKPFRIRRRRVDSASEEEVILEFPDINTAVVWMEEENENPNREYDIASVSLPR